MCASRTKALHIGLAMVGITVGAQAVADEIADLARVHREIGYVMALVDEVRERTRPDSAVPGRFRYDALTARLEAIRRDIQRHIDWEQTRPKVERFRVR